VADDDHRPRPLAPRLQRPAPAAPGGWVRGAVACRRQRVYVLLDGGAVGERPPWSLGTRTARHHGIQSPKRMRRARNALVMCERISGRMTLRSLLPDEEPSLASSRRTSDSHSTGQRHAINRGSQHLGPPVIVV
jgi:hypothetical protein